MIWKGKGMIKMEKGEPFLRSCWACNSAHEHLKKVNTLHQCFECGNMWVFNHFLKDFKTIESYDNYFKSKGMKVGDSTKKIDAGYRVMHLTFTQGNPKRKSAPLCNVGFIFSSPWIFILDFKSLVQFFITDGYPRHIR